MILTPNKLVKKLLNDRRRKDGQCVLKHFGDRPAQIFHDGAVVESVVSSRRIQCLLYDVVKAKPLQSTAIHSVVSQNDGLWIDPSESLQMLFLK